MLLQCLAGALMPVPLCLQEGEHLPHGGHVTAIHSVAYPDAGILSVTTRSFTAASAKLAGGVK